MRKEMAKSAKAQENRGVRNAENIKNAEMIENNVQKNDSMLNREFKKREKKEA